MSQRQITFFLITFLFLLFNSRSVFAASITLSDGTPDTISDFNQEYQINVNLSINASNGTVYYLRGVFYQVQTTKYCGYTWNGTSWYNAPISTDEGWKNFLPVTIASSSASITLKAKLDASDNSCQNSGTYNFKVQRFTQNSSSGTFDTQNEQTIIVSIPSSTPTPTFTPTPSPSPSPLPTATSIPTYTPTPSPKPTNTNTPTPTLKPTATATPKPTSSPTATFTLTPTNSSSIAGVFTEQLITTESGEASPSQTLVKNDKNYLNPFLILPILLSILFIAASIFLFYHNSHEGDNEK